MCASEYTGWHLIIHVNIWVYSIHICEHLSIHTGWHLRIHMNIWVCGRAWRPCAAPLAGSVPESEKSPDFSFQSLRCDGWYTHRGLSDQCQHRKSYQTPLISVILVSRLSDWMAGMRWFIWSEPASEAATSVWKFPGGNRQWILNNGVKPLLDIAEAFLCLLHILLRLTKNRNHLSDFPRTNTWFDKMRNKHISNHFFIDPWFGGTGYTRFIRGDFFDWPP